MVLNFKIKVVNYNSCIKQLCKLNFKVMKKSILIVAMLCLAFLYESSAEVKWHTWNEGSKIAQELNKPMVVFIHANWCHVCKRMESKVFSTEKISGLMNKDFIPIKLDIEQKEKYVVKEKELRGLDLISQLTNGECRGIPSTLFIPADGKSENVLVTGLKDPDEMRKLLKKYR